MARVARKGVEFEQFNALLRGASARAAGIRGIFVVMGQGVGLENCQERLSVRGRDRNFSDLGRWPIRSGFSNVVGYLWLMQLARCLSHRSGYHHLQIAIRPAASRSALLSSTFARYVAHLVSVPAPCGTRRAGHGG